MHEDTTIRFHAARACAILLKFSDRHKSDFMSNLSLSIDDASPTAAFEESELVKVIENHLKTSSDQTMKQLESMLSGLKLDKDDSGDIEMTEEPTTTDIMTPTSSSFVNVCNILLPLKKTADARLVSLSSLVVFTHTHDTQTNTLTHTRTHMHKHTRTHTRSFSCQPI